VRTREEAVALARELGRAIAGAGEPRSGIAGACWTRSIGHLSRTFASRELLRSRDERIPR
jgi:hypothetical protein